MFSSDSSRQADACRFCWMCRHICPVAGATGSEGWTPRARGLMVSMIERGTKYDPDIAETMYHCTMCEACSNDCVTGFRPTDFIREARTLALVNGIAPKAIEKEIDNITDKGNIFGLEESDSYLSAAAGLPHTGETLLFVGQAGRTVAAGTALAAMSLLKKAGVSFAVLEKEPPSGAYLGDVMGYVGEVQNAAVAAAKAIKASGAKRLIALEPHDALMFRDMYGKWDLLDGVEVVTITAELASLVAAGALTLGKTGLKGSVQEPVKLTRGLEEEKPLKDIVEAAGIEHVQFFLHGKMSRCVGTLVMDGYDPKTAELMARVRFDDAARLGSDTVIACSPDDSYLLSKHRPDGFAVIDLFELLDKNC